jgi:putative oxidoreductase
MYTLIDLRRLALRVAERLRFLPALATRLGLGIVFVQSGWGKLHDLDKVIDFFRSLGIPFPELQAPFVASVELVCGALLLVGLATRLSSLLLTCTMAVAILTAILPDVEGIGDFFGHIEPLYVLLFLYLAVYGGGALSLDAILARRLDAIDALDQPVPGDARPARA